MLKKITTIIASNHKAVVRKTIVMAGVTLGIGIGLLLNKIEDPDTVIIEELVEASEEDQEWEAAAPKSIDEDAQQ